MAGPPHWAPLKPRLRLRLILLHIIAHKTKLILPAKPARRQDSHVPRAPLAKACLEMLDCDKAAGERATGRPATDVSRLHDLRWFGAERCKVLEY